MKLAAYLTKTHIPARDFAEWIGVTPRTVDRWMRGEMIPSPLKQLEIRRKTNGKITAEDWIDGLDPSRRPRRGRR